MSHKGTGFRTTAIVLVAGAMLMPVSGAAQRGQGAAIRVDPEGVLRSGPLTRGPGEKFEVVSVLPGETVKDLLPDGATFITGTVSPSLTVVVAALPKEPMLHEWRLQWALEDRGWTAVGPGRGGFVPAGGVSMPPLTLCRGSVFADLRIFTPPDGARLLRVAVGPESQRGCAPRGFGGMTDVPLPVMVLPPGVRPTGTGGGGSLDDYEIRARLPTSLGAAALAADFGTQLEAVGWIRQSATAGDQMMQVARFQHRTRAGDPVTAILMVTTLGDSGAVDAVVRFVRHKSAR